MRSSTGSSIGYSTGSSTGISMKSSIRNIGGKSGDLFLKGAIRAKVALQSDRGDVPGWVLVVLMTTGLVTGIWTLAAPRIESILRNSLDSMNGIR